MDSSLTFYLVLGALLLGFIGISEGAIPFILKNPRLIPVFMAGAMSGALLAIALGVKQTLPLPAIWGWPLATNVTGYLLSVFTGALVCALGVLVDKDLSIVCAGGYLLQLLPGATDAEITRLEQNIAAMPSVTEMLQAGKTPQDMMELAMAGFDPQVLDTREVKYQCDCSEERTKDMLLSLGRKELVKLRDEDPKCEVVCHFCHTKYEFDLNELLAETTPGEK